MAKKKLSWSVERMTAALNKVLSNEMSIREAAVAFDVPKSTLHDKAVSIKSGKETLLEPKLGRFASTFPHEFEEKLLAHVSDLSRRCFPLNRKEFLKLAFDLAEHLKVPHQFNMTKGTAGKHFYYNFLARHPDISLRTPESTSIMRAVGFNKPQVDLFYSNLQNLLDQYNFRPSNIYNCDETGVTCVQKHLKVLAPKSARQVGKITSAERGKNVTILFCMSATGVYTPPFFVFPRKRMNERLMFNAPPDSIGVAQPNGWMNCDFFLQWLHHFVKFSHPSRESPVLIILDGHCSHKTLEVINFCRDKNVHLLCLPPHTSHKLQPLDRTFMKPFKTHYHERCDAWMRAHSGARITDYDIAGLTSEAYAKVARTDIAISGFKCTGISPFDPHKFSAVDYLPSDVTNMPLEKAAAAPSVQQSVNNVATMTKALQILSPVPDAAKRRSLARKRKSQKSEILTSTAYKVEVEVQRQAKKKMDPETLRRAGRPEKNMVLAELEIEKNIVNTKRFGLSTRKTTRPGRPKRTKQLTTSSSENI